jgi:hypothetical protein
MNLWKSSCFYFFCCGCVLTTSRYTSAEGRARALEDSDSILRANEGKSKCLRGKERMVRVLFVANFFFDLIVCLFAVAQRPQPCQAWAGCIRQSAHKVGAQLQIIFLFGIIERMMLCRANKLRAEVQLPNMQADDSWLQYFESAFEKAAKVCCFCCFFPMM